MVTTRRVRHGIILALAGLLAGLGIVAALYWSGGLPSRDEPATQSKAPAASLPPGEAPRDEGVPAAAPGSGARAAVDGDAGKAPDGSGERMAAAPSPGEGKEAGASEAPRFDIVRIEPNGDAVVAGRGKPNTVVEMLVDGKPVARALADPNGQFAIVPPPLPKGASEIVLRSRTADGQETRSPQTVAVSVSPEGKSRPLVALTSPDAPTVVLSQPGTPEAPPAAAGTASGTASGTAPGAARGTAPAPGGEGGTARIVSVDAEPGGRLFVTGAGKPGSEVRLYLNDTLIAPGKIGPDGRVTFTIGRGVAGGRYQVRLDEVEPGTGRVVHRAEVPFAMPETVATAPLAPRPGAGGTGGDGAEAARREAAKPATGMAVPGHTGQEGAVASGHAKPGTAGVHEGTGTDRTASPAVAEGPSPGRTDEAMATAPPATGTVYVPEIATARIIRGDNLWQISKRTYGRGERYTVIYDANQAQIRDPDLIYPGQIFVLPNGRRG